MKITYRQEQGDDYTAIKKVHDAAFKQQNEGELVDKLRLTQNFITELSIVAEHKGEVIGHALFYPVRICCGAIKYATLALAPVSVLPRFEKKGVGSELIKQGLVIAENKDFTSVLVLGEPDFYSKFGFEPASKWNIKPSFEVPEEAYMAKEIKHNGGLAGISGTVEYPIEFDHVK